MTLADDVDLEEYVMSKVSTNHKSQLKSRSTGSLLNMTL